VLFNGITVGDFASWVDSLLVAGLLRFGAESFKKVEDSSPEKQMAFTFQVGSSAGPAEYCAGGVQMGVCRSRPQLHGRLPHVLHDDVF
jgi:hypothetical protein